MSKPFYFSVIILAKNTLCASVTIRLIKLFKKASVVKLWLKVKKYNIFISTVGENINKYK
jgi:hypothetical protein